MMDYAQNYIQDFIRNCSELSECDPSELILPFMAVTGIFVTIFFIAFYIRLGLDNLCVEDSSQKSGLAVITKNEQQLIDKYRKLNAEQQKEIFEGLQHFGDAQH